MMAAAAAGHHVWQANADNLANPTLVLIHEDFKDLYAGEYPDLGSLMDGYVSYLEYLIEVTFRGEFDAVRGHIAAYRQARRSAHDQSTIGMLFLRLIRPVIQALKGWRPKTIIDYAKDLHIDSHQAKHYVDSSQKNVAKFNFEWYVVHNLMRRAALDIATHYQALGITELSDGFFEVRSHGRPLEVGNDGKGYGGGAPSPYCKLQMGVVGGAAWGHGYPISLKEFDQGRQKKTREGSVIGYVIVDLANVDGTQQEGDIKYTLR